MILSITLNPTFDYVYYINTLVIGAHNRFKNPTSMPGGKGVNMSRAVSLIDGEVISFVTLAGNKGKLIKSELEKEKFRFINYEIPGESRNAITIMHDDNLQTEIVEEGPEILEETKISIFENIKEIIKEESIKVVTVNGSVNTRNPFFYLELLKFLRENFGNSIKIIMDISGDQLQNVFNSKDFFPDVIKPNEAEFSELINHVVKTKLEAINFLKELNSPINTILVSFGKDGAVVKNGDNIYNISIPVINVVNPTGSGDSTVGGMAYALDNNLDFENIIKYGMAAGISNTMNDGVGEISKEQVDDLITKITINKI